ncbi:MAG TPA: hypothetical protein VGL94_10810 [Ktedonobacteraceae bacterium]
MIEKTLSRPTTTPHNFIVLQQYKPDKSVTGHACQLCSKHVACHTIAFYDDLRASMKYAILKVPQAEIEEFLWKKVVREQSRNEYKIHATLHACPSCLDKIIQEASGEGIVSLHYFAAVVANPEISLIIGRYLSDPYRPVAVFTTARTIHEFISELKEQDQVSQQRKRNSTDH